MKTSRFWTALLSVVLLLTALACEASAGSLPPTSASKLTYGTTGQCLAAASTTPASGTKATIAACASGLSWTFTTVTGGYTIKTGTVCLDGGADGTAPELWTCDGSTEQVWPSPRTARDRP